MSENPPRPQTRAANRTVPRTPRGRDDLLRKLAQERDRAVSEGETVVTTLVGPSGVGKGAVIEAALAEARAAGFTTLFGRAEAEDAPVPLSLIQSALASWASPGTGEDGGSNPEAAGALGSLFLGPLASHEQPSAEGSARARAAYETLITSLHHHDELVADRRSRLFTRIRMFLSDLAAGQPVAVALSDLQRADPGSLELVAFLLEGRPRGALWLVLGYTSEGDLTPALRRTLERQVAEGRIFRLTVDALSAADLRTLVHSTIGSPEAPAEIVEEIISRAEGAPGVALRLARAYVAQGTLPEATPTGTPSLDGVGAAALGRLTEEEERVLAVAAVAGTSFPFDLVLAVVGLPEESVAEVLESLVHKDLLNEARGGSYVFPDETLRVQVYKGLSEARRRILHKKIAEALNKLRPGDDAATVFAIARHANLGRKDDLAEVYVRKALAITETASDTAQGLPLTLQAVEIHRRAHPTDAQGLADLLHQAGALALSLGDVETAVRALTEAAETLRRAGDLGVGYAVLRLDLARAVSRRGENERARALGEEAVAIFRTQGSISGEALAEAFLGRTFYAAGDYNEAARRLGAAARILESSGASPRDLGRTLMALADSQVMHDMIQYRDAATALFEKGVAKLEEGKDFGGVVLSYLGRGAFERRLGETEAWKISLNKALEVARRMRNPRRFVEVTLRRSDMFRSVQAYDEAYALAMITHDYAHGINDVAGQATAALFAADVAGPVGLTKQAESLVNSAFQLAVEAKSPGLQAEALYRLASYAQAHRDPAKAHALFDRARELGRERSLSSIALALRRDLEEAWVREPPTGTT